MRWMVTSRTSRPGWQMLLFTKEGLHRKRQWCPGGKWYRDSKTKRTKEAKFMMYWRLRRTKDEVTAMKMGSNCTSSRAARNGFGTGIGYVRQASLKILWPKMHKTIIDWTHSKRKPRPVVDDNHGQVVVHYRYKQRVHEWCLTICEQTWSRNEVGSSRSTNFIISVHMGAIFCLFPVICVINVFW